ncbi:cytochrome P450 family protein [Ceratobasidium sp. AG-Ba]|nr:cytochrome P450 family protein [Ceratobasidium sp. AG-Ba]QRV98823.1 cytochrome P450 family protein [Ceratobasidium sp. AG-Ba]
MDYGNLDRVACACAFALVIAWLSQRLPQSRAPLPPGPPRWPLIGSLLSLPRDEPNWKTFIRWGAEFKSDIIFVPVPGQSLVVLNSHKAAIEVLERRSALYSSRPRFVMGGELVGWNQILGLRPYGDDFHRTRRLLHDGLSIKAMQTWQPSQEREALKFVQRLLDTPEDFLAHIRQTAGATVVKITYGHTVIDASDQYIRAAERAMRSISAVVTPGAFMVDIFPWLRYVPWAPFKKLAAESRKYVTDLADVPMEYVRKQMSIGGEQSLASKWLETPSDKEDHEYIVKWAAASLYAGGADTTVSAMLTFIVAMLHNPSVQLKAQSEISDLLPNRLPSFSDRENLPYVEAVYQEVLRWQPVTPLGVAHTYTGDKSDAYNGMRIPVGSMVISNIWAMLHDPSTYKDPERFNPERFLGPEPEYNPEKIAFGFGRRICPGINVAHSSLWISIALMLAAFNIVPIVDDDGKEVLPSLEYSNETVRQVCYGMCNAYAFLTHLSVYWFSYPPPFKCNITPRSDRIRQMVEEILM